MPQPIGDSLIDTLYERQQRIQFRLLLFAKATILLAFVGAVIFMCVALSLDGSYRKQFIADAFADFGLGSLISVILGLFANVVTWLFVFWSIAFIPYIVYQANRASRESVAKISTRSLRWVQLFAATFLPMVIFAISWSSFATPRRSSYTTRITSTDFIWLILCSALVVLLITLINAKIPVKFAVVRLSFFYILLYTSLFLTYGRGFTVASQATVFGILAYLTFGSEQLSELARRISLHDINPALADKYEEIINHYDALQNLKDEIQLKRKEHEAITSKQQLAIDIKQSESDLKLSQQRADVRAKGLDLTRQINTMQLQVLEEKIVFFGEVFSVLSQEMHLRLSTTILERIENLKKNVGNLAPQTIGSEMNVIIAQIDESLQGIPESLAEIRSQLIGASTEIEEATQLMAKGAELVSSVKDAGQGRK